MGRYADIAVNITNEALDRSFQYIIPERLEGEVCPGSYVRIPFGKGNRLIEGYVLEIGNEAKLPDERLKEIDCILNDNGLVESRLIKLADFIRMRYGSTMLQAMKTVFPVRKKTGQKRESRIRLLLSEKEAEELIEEYDRKHWIARERLVRALLENGELGKSLVTEKLNVSQATIKSLQEKGVIEVIVDRVYRNSGFSGEVGPKTELNSKQKRIAGEIVKSYRRGDRQTCLIRGVTGSGKTEIYMEIIEEVLREGRQVIVLIPEIALTFQTLMRFYRRFGDKVSTLHSRLSEGERSDQFERARKKEISVMIGPRSALFSPFSDLGLVVIDEEHENSYKSELTPKYHAREVAAELCRLNNAMLILGSATPSVESYYEAKQGRYKLFTIETRAKKGAELAKVETVDMREEFKRGNRSVFSKALSEGIQRRLEKGEQVMLFLNRRGYSGFVSCRMCGHVLKCPHCDVALSKHGNGKLMCHYCGYQREDVKLCPECGSPCISGMRAGTEQLEELVKKMFPYSRILRMDADTTKRKDDYERILSAFANREADILIGTQMIVKGHDFPWVTLVGIIAADMSLYANDYRASERTFELLTQAAGRAGRDSRAGEVIIQTYNPGHYSITAAKEQDYELFYREELAFRKLADYPPAGHLLVILSESEDEKSGEDHMRDLAERAKNVIISHCGDLPVRLIGPAQASISKLNDIYRQVMYVKSGSIDALMAVKDELFIYDRKKREDRRTKTGQVRISFDLDPMNIY